MALDCLANQQRQERKLTLIGFGNDCVARWYHGGLLEGYDVRPGTVGRGSWRSTMFLLWGCTLAFFIAGFGVSTIGFSIGEPWKK